MLFKSSPLILLILLVLIQSCTSEEAVADETFRSNTQALPAKANDEAVPFAGMWVNEEYLNALLATKSPRASQDTVSDVVLEVPERLSDTGMVVLGFHEADHLKLIKEGATYWSVGPYSGEKQNKILYSKRGLQVGESRYRRMKANERLSPVEEFLFSGKYDWQGRKVEFKVDGHVLGLDTIRYYEPLVDYWDAGMDVDQVILGQSEKAFNSYGFKFSADTLFIYQLECVEPYEHGCGVVEFGDELFKLVKRE